MSQTSTTSAAAQTAALPVIMSDASSEDWSLIAVKVLSIALMPQGGGTPVTVYTGPSQAPFVNLAQLDQIGELLGNASVPVGSYSGATLTVSANPGDILLTAAADPHAGFEAAPGSSIPSDQIQIQGKQGTARDLTVPVRLEFAAPLVVSVSHSNALDLEVDLGHPAFIVAHLAPGAAAPVWAVNFDGPVRRHPRADLTRLVLRHAYGNVSGIAADNTSITIAKDLPALPVQSPEVPVATGQSLQILADAVNGTLFYDVDARTRSTIKDFSAQAASLAGKYVRVAARYQQDGSLVATRVWASSRFNSVWLSPEGHVLHVDPAGNVVTVADESGGAVNMTVDANTQFYFRAPQDALADATPIGAGTGFLAAHDLVRGFKVHVSVVDPLATPLVAQSVDIETAAFDGRISAPDMTGYTQMRQFNDSADDYRYLLNYIPPDAKNGVDANGDAVTGFKWWNFAYPTLVDSGANAIGDFVAATGGAVDFGGTAGSVSPWGVSFARWSPASSPGMWQAANAVLIPTRLPAGSVANPFSNGSFTMTVKGGTTAVAVEVGTTAGSATLAYQIDRSGGIVTVSPVDVTTADGLAALTRGIVSGAKVKVYGVPQVDASIKAYVLAYYTGETPAN